MIQRLLPIVLISYGLTTSIAGAEPPLQYRKELDRGGETGEEILAVILDTEVYAATRDGFPDLRIVDDRGQMVPYLVETVAQPCAIQVREPCASKLVSGKPDEGKGLQMIVALGEKAPSATGATIRTPLLDYEHRVRVYGSQNGVDWTPLVTDGVIFDYSRFMDVRNRDVVFPGNDYRQFKFMVEQQLDERESPLRELIRGQSDGKKEERVEVTLTHRRPFRVDGIDLWRTIETAGESKTEPFRYRPVGFHVEADAKKNVSRVEIDSRREPLTGLSVATASRNFSRSAAVLIPVQQGVRTDWVEVGHGTLSVIQFRAFRRAELKVDFPEQRQQHYQLVIENADNPPLEITGVEAEGTGYRLVFLAAEGRTYGVEYGSESAKPRHYDTATVLASLRKGFQPEIIKLGPQMANPGYTSRRGVKDFINSPVFLTLAIVAMVVALAWALFRAGQRIKKLPQAEM